MLYCLIDSSLDSLIYPNPRYNPLPGQSFSPDLVDIGGIMEC